MVGRSEWACGCVCIFSSILHNEYNTHKIQPKIASASLHIRIQTEPIQTENEVGYILANRSTWRCDFLSLFRAVLFIVRKKAFRISNLPWFWFLR